MKRKRYATLADIIAALASLPNPKIDPRFMASLEARLLTKTQVCDAPLRLISSGAAPGTITNTTKHRHVLIAAAAALAVVLSCLAIVLAIAFANAAELLPQTDFALRSNGEASELFKPSSGSRVRPPRQVVPHVGDQPSAPTEESRCRLGPKGPPCPKQPAANIELSEPQTTLQSQLL